MSARGPGSTSREGTGDAAARIEAMQRELSRLRGEVASLANLYVSSYRLHGALERAEVLTVMQEIVISIVGSEEFGIFERRDGSARLTPASVVGMSAGAIEWVSSAEGVVSECIADGEMRVRPGGRDLAEGEHGARLTALVPLKRSERTVGLVAVFSMLPHKAELTTADVALLELLSTHASTSLHYADLHAHEVAEASARGDL